jgi:SAM-dependent methyltransferase
LKIIPRLRDYANLEARSLREFVRSAAQSAVREGATVLDVGAGTTPYRDLFQTGRYIATDLILLRGARLDFLSNAHRIPVKDASFDAILSTQMLEHVTDPDIVLKEFHRVLKSGGKLLLTVPLAWQLHQEPHHYYNFTRYSLALLFDRTGFQVDLLEPRGGYFKYMANKIAYSSQVFKYYLRGRWRVVLLPVFAVYYALFSILLPLAVDLLDPIDREKKLTLGYGCICTKI